MVVLCQSRQDAYVRLMLYLEPFFAAADIRVIIAAKMCQQIRFMLVPVVYATDACMMPGCCASAYHSVTVA